MTRTERFIRLSPTLFVFAAGLDLVKQVQSLLPFWLQGHELLFSHEDYEFNNAKVTVEFLYRLIDVIIFPLGWLGSAIVITLLLRIYDRSRASEAAE
jgi:hypothetical protein